MLIKNKKYIFSDLWKTKMNVDFPQSKVKNVVEKEVETEGNIEENEKYPPKML